MSFTYYKDIYNLLCKKHPNKNIYVISDHHFYHNNIILYERPTFNNVLEMNEHIIKTHNNTIKKDDIVIFLGDFSFNKNKIKKILSKMNGHKYLLLGNHDNINLIYSYGDLGFEGIFTSPVKIQDNYISHNPLIKEEITNINLKLLIDEFNNTNKINYHGHTHTTSIEKEQYINVCCEALDYKPLLIGNTKKNIKEDNKPSLIDSKHFEKLLLLIEKKHNLKPSLIISDYIYSTILESITNKNDTFFTYGSFPLYKKYNYISNFSDLDIGLIYNEKISKTKNIKQLKQLSNTMYNSILNLDNINLEFTKRMNNICIFNIIYANRIGHIYKGYSDANLVEENIYNNNDFITYSGCSTLENFLKYREKNLLNEYNLPKYVSKFLTPTADIANILLQILFQKDHNDKKILAIKKLNYIYRTTKNNNIDNISELEDTLIRFFIRNILFFKTTKRRDEIEYIKKEYKNIDNLSIYLPNNLKTELEHIFKDPHSKFNKIINELLLLNYNEISNESKKIIKTLSPSR